MVANSTRLINIGLRGTTLGTRFLFIFLLAKYLDPASLGYYGIFAATVGYAMYFVGLDFYTYVSREIVKTPANRRGQLLKSQAILSAILYIVLLPPCIWLLSQYGWPDFLIWWFLPILLLEHFNQEISRLLIALSEQLVSSIILFIRQGSWAIVVIVFMYMDTSSRNLNLVMALWTAAGVAAACAGTWKLVQLKTRGWHLPTDWRWIRKGIAVSSAFLVATLAVRGFQTFDRYWLESLGNIEMVGAYVLLIGIASTLLAFLDAAVFAFAYPGLIQLNHQGSHEDARKQVRVLLLQTLLLSAIFGLASWIALPYLLAWIGNPLYQQMVHWYPWLLSAITINAVGMVPHYALYARGEDKPIIYSHVLALITFLVVTGLSIGAFGAFAVPIGLNAAFTSLLLWKAIAYASLVHKDKQSRPSHSHA